MRYRGMVRLQIYSPNLKIYLKNCMVWPCQKGEVSSLWMNQGDAVQTAPEPDLVWGLYARPCMARRYASSSLAVSLLVERHQLLVFLYTVPSARAREDICLPDAQRAISHLLWVQGSKLTWRCSLTQVQPGDHLLDGALLAPSTCLSLLSFSTYSLE